MGQELEGEREVSEKRESERVKDIEIERGDSKRRVSGKGRGEGDWREKRALARRETREEGGWTAEEVGLLAGPGAGECQGKDERGEGEGEGRRGCKATERGRGREKAGGQWIITKCTVIS